MTKLAAGLILLILILTGSSTAQKPSRKMEALNRGVVAVRFEEKKVWISWRLFAADDDKTFFDVFRETDGRSVKLTSKPLSSVTFFVDETADLTKSNNYFVRPLLNKKPAQDSEKFLLSADSPVRQYLSIPLKTPEKYAPNDASVGDLDGDGELEIIVHQTGRGADNGRAGFTSEPVFQAYKLNGTLLWSINLGKNIREGAHYTQFLVYDFDGDGKAEFACKTADGTIDGKGKVIGDKDADWRFKTGESLDALLRPGETNRRNAEGYILRGPEYLTVFDGRTGAEKTTTKYVPSRHPDTENPTSEQLKAVWGDGYGNRVDRFLAAVAYLDGVHPSLIFARGYYTRTVLAAWDLRDGKLSQRWIFDSDSSEANKKFGGQGNHNLTVADVDGDGKDEIVYGAMVVDDDGRGLYSTGLGHGDALHVSDLDPTRPGLEVFGIQERFDDAGAHFRDARTGEILWKKPSVKAGEDGEGPGRGLSLDIDPRHAGFESWVFGAGIEGLFNAKGELISRRTPRSCNFGIYWDGDVLRELLDRNTVAKWNWEKETTEMIFTAEGALSTNGSKSTPALSGDILGDWREEIILRSADNNELRIYTTVIPTDKRFYTFLQDPQYRLSLAWQNVGYNQPPHLTFFFGNGMKQPPKPSISPSQNRLP